MLDVAIPADPGSHTISVRRGAHETLTRDVTLDDGGEAEVVLDLAQETERLDGASRAQAPAIVPVDRTSTSDGDGGVLGKWWFWTAAGAVVAGAVVLVLVLTLGGGSQDAVLGNGDPPLIRIGGGS